MGLPPPSSTWYCSLKLARRIMPAKTSCGLGNLVKALGLEASKAHRAEDDARMMMRVLFALAKKRPSMDLMEVLHLPGAPHELDAQNCQDADEEQSAEAY